MQAGDFGRNQSLPKDTRNKGNGLTTHDDCAQESKTGSLRSAVAFMTGLGSGS